MWTRCPEILEFHISDCIRDSRSVDLPLLPFGVFDTVLYFSMNTLRGNVGGALKIQPCGRSCLVVVMYVEIHIQSSLSSSFPHCWCEVFCTNCITWSRCRVADFRTLGATVLSGDRWQESAQESCSNSPYRKLTIRRQQCGVQRGVES